MIATTQDAEEASSGPLPRERLLEDIYCSDCVDDGIEYLWQSVSNAITKQWLKTIDGTLLPYTSFTPINPYLFPRDTKSPFL